MRAGTPSIAPGAAPNNASGRLLPVDVNPGTRQSLTVFHHLDGHRPHELHLPLVERRPMDHLAHRAHHPLRLPRLEELDHPQRRLDVREQALETSAALRAGIAEKPGLRVPGAFEGFELAMRAILGQQVTVKAATTLAGRVAEKFG